MAALVVMVAAAVVEVKKHPDKTLARQERWG